MLFAPSFHRNAIKPGTYGIWPLRRAYRLSPRDVATHMHVIGVSGSGKSRFLAHLFLELHAHGMPATLIDPHGDLARLVLAKLVERGVYRDERAFRRIMYLDLPAAAQQERYLPLNVLEQYGRPYDAAANVLEAFHRAWPQLAAGGAPMFDTLVQNGVKALISARLPLTALYRFLTDKAYRDAVLAQEADPDVVSVFHDWYDRLSARDQLDQSGSTVRRVNLLTFDPVLKYSLGQPTNALNFRSILDQRQSVIVNLALPNPAAKRLFGCLLTVGAEQGALSRSDLPPETRHGTHHLIIDEFPLFTAQSEEALTATLSQTRKFGLLGVYAHQNWSQTSARLKGALSNVGIEVVFRLGREDAEYTAKLLGSIDPLLVKHVVEQDAAKERTHPVFSSLPEQWESWVADIQNLRTRQAYLAQYNVQPWPIPWRWIFPRSPRRVVKLKTATVDDARVGEELARVERRYLETYFRTAQDVHTLTRGTPVELPAYPTRREPRRLRSQA